MSLRLKVAKANRVLKESREQCRQLELTYRSLKRSSEDCDRDREQWEQKFAETSQRFEGALEAFKVMREALHLSMESSPSDIVNLIYRAS
jgi:chromosome segregation ATPase